MPNIDPNMACPIHLVLWVEFNKNGKTWYSHKNADGSWCNKAKVDQELPKAPTPPQQGSFISPEDRRSYRIERQHSQEMAIRFFGLANITADITESTMKDKIKELTDWFHKDLDEK